MVPPNVSHIYNVCLLTSAAALHRSCTVHRAFFQLRRNSPLATKFAKRAPGDEHRQVAAVERHHLSSAPGGIHLPVTASFHVAFAVQEVSPFSWRNPALPGQFEWKIINSDWTWAWPYSSPSGLIQRAIKMTITEWLISLPDDAVAK